MVKMIVSFLATWCLAVLLYDWSGLRWLRKWAGVYGPNFKIETNPRTQEDYFVPETFIGRQLDCFWCCSLWSGLIVAVVCWIWWYALIPPACAGVSIWIGGGGRIIWRSMVDG